MSQENPKIAKIKKLKEEMEELEKEKDYWMGQITKHERISSESHEAWMQANKKLEILKSVYCDLAVEIADEIY